MTQYIYYFKLRIITNLQYRSSAIAGILTQLFFGFSFIMVYLAFYESNNTTNVMGWNSIVTYLWLQQAFFALTFPYIKDNELLDMITNGNLAYELIRPQNFYIKFYIKMISNRLVSVLLRFLPIIIIGLILPYPYKLSLPYSLSNFILFLISLTIACLLVTSFSLIIHILTMFTIDSRGLFASYGVIAELFMGSIIPLPFLPSWLFKIASILPFKYIADYPFRIYINDITLSDGSIYLICSIIWLVVSIIFGYLLSKYALKKAVVQGG